MLDDALDRLIRREFDDAEQRRPDDTEQLEGL